MKINNLVKKYDEGNNIINALNDVSFELPNKGMVFVTGKSGSGKSTLLYIIGGLIKPTSGQVIREYDSINSDDIIRKTGFIFQNYNLFNNLTVMDNILISSKIKGNFVTETDINNILKQFDIKVLANKKVSKLSGGEQQRVAIARALIANPTVLLADEPTGNLDEENSRIVNETLKRISKDKLVIYVTHDLDASKKYGDYIINLSSGKVDNISIINKMENHYPIGTLKNNQNIKKENLKITYKFAHKLLFSKFIRFFISIFSLVIASLLLLIVLSLSNYNVDKVVSNYFNDYDVTNYTLYETKSYDDLFGTKMNFELYSGKLFYNMLKQNFEEKYIAKTKLNISTNSFIQNPNIFFISSTIKIKDMIFESGSFINSYNEIVISDYLATANQLSTGDSVALFNKTFYISGVFSTDYEESNYISKKSYGNLSLIDSYNEKYDYLGIYANYAIFDSEEWQEMDLLIQENSLMKEPTMNVSMSSSVRLSLYTNDVNITKGRIPVLNTEIVISERFAYELGLYDGVNFHEDKYSFYNYDSVNFNSAYNNILNLYNFFPDGVKIVGITDLGFDNIYILDDIYEEIRIEQFNYYFFDEYRIFNDSIINEEFMQSLGNDIYFYEPCVSSIYQFNTMLEKSYPVLIILLIIFTILSFFMLITMFLNTFYNGKKDIAILQSLGLSIRSTITIFIIQCIEVFLITFIGLLIFYYISIVGINSYFFSLFPIRRVDIYLFDIKSLLVAIAELIIVAIVCNIILIKKVSIANIIDTLRAE